MMKGYKMQVMIDGVEYIRQSDVEKLLGMKGTSLYYMTKFSDFPKAQKIEFRQLWRKSEVEEYLRQHGKMNEKADFEQ